jgi:phosphatidylglycerophosphate synthase
MMKFSKQRIREVYWKSCSHEGYLNIYVYRRISIRLAVIFAKMRMTPNQVTVWSFIFSMIAAAMFGFESMTIALLGLIPFHIGKILDCADGQLASLTDQRSALGAFLDPFFDRIVDAATLTGLAVGLYVRTDNLWGIFMVLAFVVAQFVNAYLDKYSVAEEKTLDNLRSTTKGLPPAVARLAKWDGGFTGLIVSLALVFNGILPLIALFLAIAAVTIPLQFKKIYLRLKAA